MVLNTTAIFQIWTERSVGSTLHFMLVTLKLISSQDLLALESQMFPDCLYIHQHQESSSCSLVSLCPCCPSCDCSANSPSFIHPCNPVRLLSSSLILSSSLHVCVLSGFGYVRLFATPWAIACQDPVSRILQVRILEWVVTPSLIFPTRDQTHLPFVSWAGKQITTEPLRMFSSSLDHKYSLSVNMDQEPC